MVAQPGQHKFIEVETRGGIPVVAGSRTLTPFSQSLVIRVPGRPGGLIWNRPVSVLVQTEGGEQILRIRDVTRWALWSLMLASLTFFMISFWIKPLTGNRDEEE